METTVIYPIGQQDFKTLREDGCIYVDKTEYIVRIIRQKAKYLFLGRPRRFGKSLFLSTLQYFFEGRRDLFRGLCIDSIDWKWEHHPVLRIDLNTGDYSGTDGLVPVLDGLLSEWENRFGVTTKYNDLSQRLKRIIAAAHEQTGHPVVILVDEYDKPFVRNLNDDDKFEHYRSLLASVYSNFKSSAEHIALVFLTGVSRFSKLSAFSYLNNIKDISFSNEYSDICGITEKELFENFSEGIRKLADKRAVSFEDASLLLKANYDGYRFSEDGSDIYNPWSVLNAMDESRIGNFWNLTGMPTIIAESLKRVDADLIRVFESKCALDSLAGLDLRSANPVALLYQTGYLTIKQFNRNTGIVTLGIPNKEVKEGLFNVLLPYYVNVRRGTPEGVVFDIIDYIHEGLPRQMMKSLDAYIAGIPYDLGIEDENNFQNALYILLSLIGLRAKVEEHTSDGRIDLLIETPRYVYIIELKYGQSSQAALNQIESKQYARKFSTDSRRLFKIGANFSPATRRIDDISISESC